MSDKKTTPIKDWINQYKEQFNRYNSYCEANNWIYSEEVEQEYKAQKEISNIVLNRLNYFTSKFEPYLEYNYVQEFISLMITPVNLFLERCNIYFLENDWLKETKKDKQLEEMTFQSNMMTDFNSIKDKLQKLNLDNEVVALDIKIHSDKVIPLLMKDIMEEKYPEIKDFREKFNNQEDNDEDKKQIRTHITSEISNSTEFFINIKNVPYYDPNKHYYEQKEDVIQFFEEERDKIENGVNIAGVYISPWLYWHINYFITDIPSVMLKGTPKYNPKKPRIKTNPLLRDNELFFAECYEEAKSKNVGLFGFGTRRYSKTVQESSVLCWRTTIVENSESLVIGGDDGDLQKLTKSLEIGFSEVHPAFRLPRNNNDWSKLIQFGLKDKAGNRIPYSDVFIRNVNAGKDGSSEKTAGATPTAWIADEAGKFNCKAMYQAAIPSFQNPEGWALVPLLFGTGGNKILSADAQDMLLHPEANDILPMNWETLEKYVDEKDLVTWKKSDFGIFFPAQMSFKEGLKKKETNLADFFQINDNILRNIELKITNWEESVKIIQRDRDKKLKDKTALNKEKMYYPIDPMECFLNRIDNPFPANEAQEHKEELIRLGNIGRPCEITKKQGTTNINIHFSDKEIAEFPFKGGNIDSPILIFENPPEDNLIDGTYVAGLDHYKHDKSSTESLGALYIFKRFVNINDEWANRVVASYCSRPETIDKFNTICEVLLEGYGAVCLQENADISFQQHLIRKHKADLLLAKGEEFAQKYVNPNSNQNNKFGLNPNPKNQQYILNLVINYCQEDIIIGEDENGLKITVKGVTRINDIALLDEIINFNYTGNFDRIISFGHSLAWALYLDSLNIMPKPKINREDNEYRKQVRKQQLRNKSPYSYKKFNPYRL